MGWTSTVKLYILFEDGRFVIFSNLGEILCTSNIFTESLTDMVLYATSYDNGFLAFTKNNRMYALFTNSMANF